MIRHDLKALINPMAFIALVVFDSIGQASAKSHNTYLRQIIRLTVSFAAGDLPDTAARIIASSPVRSAGIQLQ